jgi:hypothetical protein
MGILLNKVSKTVRWMNVALQHLSLLKHISFDLASLFCAPHKKYPCKYFGSGAYCGDKIDEINGKRREKNEMSSL